MGKIGFMVGMILISGIATAAAVPLDTTALRDGWQAALPDDLCNYCEDYEAAAVAPEAVATAYLVGAGYTPGAAAAGPISK